MIPVTHVVWVGLLLTLVGAGAVVSRTHPASSLAGGIVSSWGVALVAVAYARWWGNEEGQLLAVTVVLAGALTVAALLAVRARREER